MVLGPQSHRDPWSHSHHSPSEACIHQSPRLHQTFLHQNLNLYLPNFLSGNYKPKYYFNFDISSVKFQWHSYHEAKHSLKVECELNKACSRKARLLFRSECENMQNKSSYNGPNN